MAIDGSDPASKDRVGRHTEVGGFSQHRSACGNDGVDTLEERDERDWAIEHNWVLRPVGNAFEVTDLPIEAGREDDLRAVDREIVQELECQVAGLATVIVAFFSRWPKKDSRRAVRLTESVCRNRPEFDICKRNVFLQSVERTQAVGRDAMTAEASGVDDAREEDVRPGGRGDQQVDILVVDDDEARDSKPARSYSRRPRSREHENRSLRLSAHEVAQLSCTRRQSDQLP